MPKRYLTGGGKDLKNQSKSICYPRKIFSFVKFYIKKILAEKTSILSDRRIKKILDATSHCRGAILIEFAICMPVLIILLFYIHDLVKIKRLYSQTEFVAQQMANILQNIAKTREITKNDIKYAASLAYLTIYPGTTMYSKKSGSEYHTFNHQPRVYMYYVKGESGGKASVVWGFWARAGTAIEPKDWHGSGALSTQISGSNVLFGKNVTPSSIYPTLKIEEGRAKVIIETQLRWNSGAGQRDANGKSAKSAREVFGCYLVNPNKRATAAYFPSVVIFTPNRGFTEKMPS